jgi:hypothetical protein
MSTQTTRTKLAARFATLASLAAVLLIGANSVQAQQPKHGKHDNHGHVQDNRRPRPTPGRTEFLVREFNPVTGQEVSSRRFNDRREALVQYNHLRQVAWVVLRTPRGQQEIRFESRRAAERYLERSSQIRIGASPIVISVGNRRGRIVEGRVSLDTIVARPRPRS